MKDVILDESVYHKHRFTVPVTCRVSEDKFVVHFFKINYKRRNRLSGVLMYTYK